MADLDSFLHKAQLLLQHRKPSEAEKQLAYVIQQDPQNTQALSLLGRCKFEQRKFGEGIDLIKKAITISPEEDYYFYLLAFGHYQISKHVAARENLHIAIQLNPYVSDYFGLLSLILIEEKDFKKALVAADDGLAVNAENITCLNARSTALNKMKFTDDAMETMRNALEQDPENDFTHTTIGWNLLEKGRNRDATVHFKEALRINPDLEGARVGLKESLKSKIPPYKWLLQYSFWINNKGKHARWIIPLGIYLIVRLIMATSDSGTDGKAMIGGIVLGLYLLLVATSWIINPLANFFLLFNKDSKYALTKNEKLNSLLLIGAMVIAASLFIAGIFSSGYYRDTGMGRLEIAALITLSMGLPLGHMRFPVTIRNNSKLQWYSMSLVIGGLIVLLLLLASTEMIMGALMAYAIAFVIYTWLNAFLPR